MIVYVESNFVLELAFLQEEFESAEAIVALGEAGRIRLVLPAYSVGEPYERMVRRAQLRKDLREKLSKEILELSRSRPYGDLADASRDLTRILTESADEERSRLDAALMRLLATAEVIPLNGAVLEAAHPLERELDLSPQDALIFASVLAHLESAPEDEHKVFLTRNRKDFGTNEIEERLQNKRCKILFRFADGTGYLNSVLGSAG